jgi:hypothetical protein
MQTWKVIIDKAIAQLFILKEIVIKESFPLTLKD